MALRKFVRYRNRKMHEVGSATMHVSMDDLSSLVAKGDALEVIDDATGEDLTVAVLARILYNHCLKDSTTVEEKVLRGLIVDASKRAA
jgi:polyhydroxyalkanoate synthesis regulator protein